jgi:hypothetical protein
VFVEDIETDERVANLNNSSPRHRGSSEIRRRGNSCPPADARSLLQRLRPQLPGRNHRPPRLALQPANQRVRSTSAERGQQAAEQYEDKTAAEQLAEQQRAVSTRAETNARVQQQVGN